MASLELITNLKLIDGSARTTVPTPEELPLGYMCFGIVNSRASIWGNYDGSVHDLVEEGTHQVSGDLNLENGTGTGSLVQKRLKSDGVTWTTTKAYQGASTALGGGTQAGRTEEEFNAYFWDSTTNEAINGGKGKNSEGKILDNNGLTYEKSYSYGVAEGELTKALGRSSHAEGNNTEAIGTHSHAEGLSTHAEGYAAHAEGNTTSAIGAYSHAEGTGTTASGENSHAEGVHTTASGFQAHAEGNGTKALDSSAHAEGQSTTALGENSHAEGKITTASGTVSHAEGESTTASGLQSHAEGYKTTASGEHSHAEGSGTTASVGNSHAEGFGTVASNNESHAEGNQTIASGLQSHAEGIFTKATGMHSHAEGYKTIAEGENSHAEGYYTKATNASQHAAGKFNAINNSALFIVGNGTSDNDRKNAFEVLKDGRAKAQSAPTESDDVVRKQELDNSWNNFNLENGTGVGSLVQKTVSSSGTPYNNEASGSGSVAFGKDTKSKGNSSFVTGQKNTATENASRGFVGGYDNTIDNATTFAFGQGLKNSRERKASFGQWNKDEYDTLLEVGYGTSDTDRRNAFEVRNNGTVIMKERAKVYGEPQDPTDVIRKQDLDKPYELIEEITLTEDTAKIDRAGYNLKDVYIYVNAPRYTDTHGITFVVNGGNAISCSDVINKNFNAISALYASIKGNLLFMGYTQNTNSDSNVFNYKQRIPVVNIPRINRLTFQQDVGKVMPAGIVIKIYGR